MKDMKFNDLDEWFARVLTVFRYIPVAIVDHDTKMVMFLDRVFYSLEEFHSFFDGYKGIPINKLNLDAYYVGDEPKLVNRAELYKIFKGYVRIHEKKVGVTYHSWTLMTQWQGVWEDMRAQIKSSYPKRDMSIKETAPAEKTNKEFITYEVIPQLKTIRNSLKIMQKSIITLQGTVDMFLEKCKDQIYEIPDEEDYFQSPPPDPLC